MNRHYLLHDNFTSQTLTFREVQRLYERGIIRPCEHSHCSADYHLRNNTGWIHVEAALQDGAQEL